MAVNEFVNTNEAADIIGVTTGRVRQMLIDGSLAGMRANQRAWLVRRDDAEAARGRESKRGRPRISERAPKPS